MKKNSLSSKVLSVFLSVLMVLSVGVVGLTPLAEYANAAIEIEEDTGNPVFNLKWNVPESIYLKPGSGDFEYFLTNTLTASGATAIGDAAKSCDVTAVAPMADSMTLTYELEANGKKPDGSAVSASGLSLNIANNVTGAQSLTNTLTGKALSGYTDAIAGNEYFIKWTMKFKVTTKDASGRDVQDEYTEYAYTSVYVPSLLTAGSSIFFKAAPTIGFKPRNSVYSFLTGGHTVSGGNGKASRFTSSNIAGLEANKTIHKDNLASATFVSPLVAFTGGNSYNGSKTDDIDYVPDYPFANGGSVPAGNRMFDRYTVIDQANGGVYATSESKGNGQWFQLSDMSAAEAPKLNITIDASRFADYSQVPNLSAGWMQYGAYGIESGNRLRWIAGVNTGTSYNGSTAKGMLTGNDAKEDTIQAGKVAVACNADTTDERSNYVSLARGLSELSGTVASGHNVMMYAYKTVYDGIGSSTSTNAVIAGADLNVTATNKQALRTKTCEAYVNGSGIKTGANDDAITAYINAVAAADKVLADQFATQTEIDNALTALNNKASNDVKTTIENYYKDENAPVLDIVAFNVPETIYLNPTDAATSSYGYVYDQSLTVIADKDTQGNLTGTHTATVAVNKPTAQADDTENKLPAVTKSISSGGIIEFFCATADPDSVKLYCSDANAVFGTKGTDGGVKLTKTGDGLYSASVTSGTHAYESGYITWYVQFTDTVDGMQKTATAKTYIYAPYLAPVGAASYVRDETAGHKKVHLAEISWWSGVHSRGDKPSWNGIGTEDGGSFEGYANTKDDNASYYLSPLVDGIGATTGNVDSSNWLNTSGSSGLPLTMRYNTFYKYNGGNKWVTAATTGYKALLNVDTSRITNLKDVPYLTVGTMLTQAENTSSNQNYYLAETTNYYNGGKNDDDQKHNTYSTSGDISITSGTYNTDTDTNGGSIYNSFYTKDLSGITANTVSFAYEAGFEGTRDDGWLYKIAYPCVTTYCPIEVTLSNKQAIRNSILASQELFTKLGIYYNGTNYSSLYYKLDSDEFNTFINAYESAQETLTKVDGAAGSVASTLDSATEDLEEAIKDAAAATATEAQKEAILKNCVSKQYNVSYDASGDKILRVLNNAESKAVTFTEDFFAKDDIEYTAESYDGYDFLGFIKSTADLSYAGITGSQVMSGTPDYLTSVNDYQNQAVTTSSFGATSAVSYPNTLPAVSASNIVYSDTVDAAIYMIGVYQPHHYTVTYKANGGTGADVTANNVYGAAFNIAANTFSRTNYTFTGWNTEADGSGTAYTAGAALALASMPTDDGAAITLYAQWQADPNAVANYTIQILVKNASGEYEQQGETVTGTGVNGDIINPSTVIDGLVFLASESTAFPYTLRAGQTNAIVLIYEYAKYTATFKNADGSATIKTQNDVPVGTTPTAPSNPDNYNDAAYHYTFAGWAQTANATTVTGVVPMTSDGDVTYYAVFTAAAHTYDLGKYISSYDAATATYYHQRLCDDCDRPEASMNAHSFGATPIAKTLPTCKDPGSATYKCADCGFENSVVLDIDPDAHGELTHTAYKAETCTAAGNIEYWTCPLCGDYFSDQSGTEITEASTVIPAKGHDFTAKPTFNWSSDYSSCTATYICKNDATHTEDKTCTVTSVTTAPTCTVDGYIDYTAKVTYDTGYAEWNETKRGAGEGKLGHEFGAWAHTEGALNADSTHTRTCQHAGCTESESTPCTFDNVVTPATYKDQGYTTHTCTVCGYSYEDTYTDALGCDLTINYYFTGTTTKAAEPKTAHGAYGEDYNFASPAVTGYTASQTAASGAYAEASKTVTVYYSANTNTAFTVKHYQQNANGVGYTEAESETLYGTTAATTNVTAKTYTGFTAQTIDQQTIKADGSTVVSVYYDRDVYSVTWNIGDGATVNAQPTEVLYGNDIDFTVSYGTGYDQVKPAVSVSGGTLTGTYKVTNITGNVTINVPTQKNKYAVTVSGDAGVTVSEGKTVEYLDSYVLTVTAKENYTQTPPTATVNGTALTLVKGEGNTYTATIADIAEAKAIVVTSTIDSHKLTVTYKYADNSEAATTVSKDVNYGSSYSETCPTIDKFVPVIVIGDTNVVTAKVEGTMGASDVTVNVVYLADENGNGTPDVDDSKLTVTFDYGRYGTAAEGQVYAAKVLPNTAYADITKPTVNAKDGFTFDKWLDDGITTITGDITIYASYTTKDENNDDITVDNNTYLIKFVNYDGTLLKAIAADAGETISAPADPTRGDFTFAGWTPAVKTTVEGDATYTATFKTAKTEGGEEEVIGANEYVVSFYTFDGKLIKAEFVVAGSTVTAPEVPDREGFTKNGWTPAFDAAKAVNADASYTASYKTALTEGGDEEVIEAGKYVIKFFTFDGKLLESFVKAEGDTFTAPAVPDRENTTSKAWAPTVKTTVDGDATYTATYKTKLDPEDTEETDVPAGSYVISFYTYDGELIERQIVAEGGDVIAPDAPARGDFTFAGWTPAFADKANADVQYKATYKTKLNPDDTEETVIPDGYCVVTFENYNGDLVEAKLVKKGETTTAPATAPTRDNCTFKAWAPAFSESDAVNEDKTYTATFTTTDENGDEKDVPADSFVVGFYNYDDSLIKCFIVADGEKISAPTAVRGDFTFAGWTPSFTADAEVHADASYKATFKTALVPGGSEQLIPDGKFVVSFYTYTGRLIEARFVTAGYTTNAPEIPARANCTANGWTPAFDKDAPVTADAGYTASYTTKLTEDGAEVEVPAGMFVVRFLGFDHKLVAAVLVAANGDASAPDMSAEITNFDSKGHYGFAKWDKTFSGITADTTVNALYGFSDHVIAYKDVVDATCTENGSMTEYCLDCGYEEHVVVPATGHKPVTDPAVAPTCTETGLTEGAHCEKCEMIITAQKKVPAAGHSFGSWTIVKYAAETEDGVMMRVCSKCGFEDTKTYAKSDEYLVFDASGILPAGQSVHIPVIRMPAGIEETNVTWTSSDESVAFADEDGNIMVIGMGSVTLTATTPDGLTLSKTFVINNNGSTRIIKFQNIDKMHYAVGGTYYVYNNGHIMWSKDYACNIRVKLYQTFAYKTVIVRANGVELKENANGTYTIPAGEEAVVITVEGAAVDQNTGSKISFWQMLINFFKRIIAFFTGKK